MLGLLFVQTRRVFQKKLFCFIFYRHFISCSQSQSQHLISSQSPCSVSPYVSAFKTSVKRKAKSSVSPYVFASKKSVKSQKPKSPKAQSPKPNLKNTSPVKPRQSVHQRTNERSIFAFEPSICIRAFAFEPFFQQLLEHLRKTSTP